MSVARRAMKRIYVQFVTDSYALTWWKTRAAVSPARELVSLFTPTVNPMMME